MLTTFAHAGHSHAVDTVKETAFIYDWYHCMPIIVIAMVVVVILLGVILYLLHTWQPKPKKSVAKKNSRRKS